MELYLMIFGALISVMNPLGTVPVFVGLTKEHTVSGRNRIAFWTSLNVLIILLISFFGGTFILVFFGITLNSLKIAGGLIITLSGFALLSGEYVKHKGMKKEKVMNDIKEDNTKRRTQKEKRKEIKKEEAKWADGGRGTKKGESIKENREEINRVEEFMQTNA
mgnify:CR=1 FL=1